jgi:predicted trehalose synthase
VPLPSGDTAVVAVSAVREDPSGDAKEQEAQMRREFARAAAAVEAQGYAAAARADAKVSLNLQAIE